MISEFSPWESLKLLLVYTETIRDGFKAFPNTVLGPWIFRTLDH